jgi:hypothetical protein
MVDARFNESRDLRTQKFKVDNFPVFWDNLIFPFVTQRTGFRHNIRRMPSHLSTSCFCKNYFYVLIAADEASLEVGPEE